MAGARGSSEVRYGCECWKDYMEKPRCAVCLERLAGDFPGFEARLVLDHGNLFKIKVILTVGAVIISKII